MTVHTCLSFFRNYSSEIHAFGHRIGARDVSQQDIIKALTSESFFSDTDVEKGVFGTPTKQFEQESNIELTKKGKSKLVCFLSSYLRFHLPHSPEELIEAVVCQLSSDKVLTDVAKHIGLDLLIRTKENPPSDNSMADAFCALLDIMGESRARALIIDMVVPQLIDIDFADIFSLYDPLAVLSDLLKQQGIKEVEPRLLRSAGEVSAQPVFVVGLYNDKKELVGQSAGESLEIAVDMAAREGLLRLWGVTVDRIFLFGEKARQIPFENFTKENYRLKDKCSAGTNLSVQKYVENEPLNIVEVAMRYRNKVEDVVGKSYTRRLRHKFSRGSLAKRSFRYLVKPKVYTVS